MCAHRPTSFRKRPVGTPTRRARTLLACHLVPWLPGLTTRGTAVRVAADMNQVKVERKQLQLVGIGALCLACKHEEVMIPNMNDFIFICDKAYTLEELMVMEVDILTTLQVQLHVPTAHDMLLPMLTSLHEAPAYPDAKEYTPLRSWCECLLLLGQAHYPVVLHDASTLARCVATLGGLLSRGVHNHVVMPDGSTGEGKSGTKVLHERLCFLKPGDDWKCMEQLLEGIELAVKESREMLIKCHAKFCEMHKLQSLLDKYRGGERKATHLHCQDVRPLLDRHYSTDKCKDAGFFLEKPTEKDEEEEEDKKKLKKAYLKAGKAGTEHTFSIVAVTLAIGALSPPRRPYGIHALTALPLPPRSPQAASCCSSIPSTKPRHEPRQSRAQERGVGADRGGDCVHARAGLDPAAAHSTRRRLRRRHGRSIDGIWDL